MLLRKQVRGSLKTQCYNKNRNKIVYLSNFAGSNLLFLYVVEIFNVKIYVKRRFLAISNAFRPVA